MGVQGLLNYLMLHKYSTMQEHKLRNTRVVIDGNNLLYYLYHHENTDWLYAGEYDIYADSVARFFNNLSQCKIEPFVVFDGCYDLKGGKLATIKSRAKERVKSCAMVKEGRYQGKFLLPLLTGETLVEELNRLGVRHVTCCWEGDSEAAALANYWSCPVISDDSDFFIFPLEGGFVPLKSLNFHPGYMSCNLYRIEQICLPNVLRIRPCLMPLFATLMGNDFVRKGDFDQFFTSISLPESMSQYNGLSRNEERIVGLLRWLGSLENVATEENLLTAHRIRVATALDKVVDKLKENERARLRTCIEKSLAQYSTEDAWIVRYIENPEVMSEVGDFLPGLPSFLKVAFHQRRFLAMMTGCYSGGQVILPCLVEDIDQPSVFEDSMNFRSLVYSMLGGLQKVAEFGRCRNELVITSIELEESSFQLSPDLTRKEAMDILHSKFDIPQWDLQSFKDDGPLMTYMVLMYLWLSFTEDNTSSKPHCLAAFASCLYLLSQGDGALLSEVDEIKAHQKERFTKFFKTRVLNIPALHHYNQLQCCFMILGQLNVVLCGPLVIPPVKSWFCGRLFHNLVDDLERRRHPELFLSELFGRRSRAAVFLELVIGLLGGVQHSWSGARVMNMVRTVEETGD